MRRIGEEVTGDEVRESFDRAFGSGAGRRVLLDCAGGEGGAPLVQELRIAVRGDLLAGQPLADMIRAAPTQPRGCREGRVDPPGFG